MGFNNRASGGGLALILAFAAIGVGVIGWALPTASCPKSPASPCWTKVQKGVGSCTITAGLAACTKVFAFSPAYTVIPYVGTELNATCGTNCQSAASVTIASSTVQSIGTVFFPVANGTAWVIQGSNAELYNGVFARTAWTTPTSFTSQTAYFCVDLITNTGFGPTFTVQFSTNQASWTNMGSDGLTVSPIALQFLCSAVETTSLTANTLYYFRVMANDAVGPVTDLLGTMELYMAGSFTPASITTSVACLTDLVAETVSSLTVGVACGTLGIAVSKTFTINWWAGIPT